MRERQVAMRCPECGDEWTGPYMSSEAPAEPVVVHCQKCSRAAALAEVARKKREAEPPAPELARPERIRKDLD